MKYYRVTVLLYNETLTETLIDTYRFFMQFSGNVTSKTIHDMVINCYDFHYENISILTEVITENQSINISTSELNHLNKL